MNAPRSNPRPRSLGVWGSALVAALLAASSLCAPSHVLAQSSSSATTTTHPIKADFKGATGLGLIGMELGFVVPAVAGARGAWPYIVFPIAGAGGGAAAGYFLLEKGSGHPKLAVASLVTGMALLIPSLVLTLAETAYEPDEEAPTASLRRRLESASAAGPGLVRWSEKQGVFVAPPGIGVEPGVSPQEALRTGASSERVLHASVLSGVF